MAKKAKQSDADRLRLTRNIGIIAHIDAGKTTTTERILYYTGRQHRMGTVDDGNTTTDFDQEEADRGITIYTAAVSCEWTPKDGETHHINILDTPGHVDFTAEVERSLRVLDGAVGVFCAVGGVEAQSETVWRQADKYGVPRIAFINKLDRSGADFHNAVGELSSILSARPAILQLPVGHERDFYGVIDLVERRLISWQDDELGAEYTVGDIPEDLADEAALYREQLIDLLTEEDEELMEKVLMEESTPADVHAAIRRRTLAEDSPITPVLCGTSLRNKGVQPLLDAVCRYLPSPLDLPPVRGLAPKRRKKGQMDASDTSDWNEVERGPERDAGLSALIFKSIGDKHGDLLFFRVYSGVVKEGQMVLNMTRNKKERVAKLYRMYAKQREQIKEAGPGDIVATVGARFSGTGDTLCEASDPILLESISFPDTVVSRAVEPKSTADSEKLMAAIRSLERDDPTFRASEDPETRQLVLSGMGELHLEVIKNRIERDFKVAATFRDLRVAYKQALAGSGAGQGRYSAPVDEGPQPFAEVELELERRENLAPGKDCVVTLALDPEQVPRSYWPAIEEGVKGAAQGSYEWGYPLIQVGARVTAVRFDPVLTGAEAFSAASSRAFEAAVKAAGVELLEPIMLVEVVVPEEKFGDILNDLTRRGAEIVESGTQKGTMRVIKGKVPLASMFGYGNEFRSLTSGRGSFSMEPEAYAVVPPQRRPKMF